MRGRIRILSIWALALLTPYAIAFALLAVATSNCHDANCGDALAFFWAPIAALCTGLFALVGVLQGVYAWILAMMQTTRRRQIPWLIGLIAVALVALIPPVLIYAVLPGSFGNDPIYGNDAIGGNLFVTSFFVPVFLLPSAIVTLLYGIFGDAEAKATSLRQVARDSIFSGGQGALPNERPHDGQPSEW